MVKRPASSLAGKCLLTPNTEDMNKLKTSEVVEETVNQEVSEVATTVVEDSEDEEEAEEEEEVVREPEPVKEPEPEPVVEKKKKILKKKAPATKK